MSFLPLPDFSLIIGGLLLWILIMWLLAPLEALGWWAGWFESDDLAPPSTDQDDAPPHPKTQTSHYLVFLTGISGVSGDVYLPEEIALLRALDERLPHVVLVDDIYPYGITNEALTGQRVFAWFWRFALRMKLSGRRLQRFVGFLINIRNAAQVAVSGDRRYGPIYNSGSARMIARGLRRHGYPFGSGTPVTLLGYSGGGQIALGAVPYLQRMIGAPIDVISLGGVFFGDPGIANVRDFYHLYGTRDGVQRTALWFAPSRWQLGGAPLLFGSRWNQARREGKIRLLPMGSMTHSGRHGYLDDATTLPNGTTHFEQTVQVICQLLTPPPPRTITPPHQTANPSGTPL